MEALLAFFIIALGALAIANMLNRSLELNADGEARTEALHLAKETIADFRDFATKTEALAYASDSTGNTVTGDHAVFTRTWDVSNVSGNDNAILLSVNVAWDGVSGAQNIKLTSQIAKLEPEEPGAYLIAYSGSGAGSTGGVTDPTDPDDPTDPTDPSDPNDPTDPTDPSDPNDPTDPEHPDPDPDPISYSCECSWAANNNYCPASPISVISTPSNGACCAEACDAVRPTGKFDCKNTTPTVNTQCVGGG